MSFSLYKVVQSSSDDDPRLPGDPTASDTIALSNSLVLRNSTVRGLRVTALDECTQLHIDPADDNVEENEPIDRAHGGHELALDGCVTEEVAQRRLVGEEAFAESLAKASRRRTFLPCGRLLASLLVDLDPPSDRAQNGVNLAHDRRRDRDRSRSRYRRTTTTTTSTSVVGAGHRPTTTDRHARRAHGRDECA